MKTNVKRFGFWLAVALTIIAPVQVHAVCQIVGYTTDGYIIECDGSDTFGITSGDGVDIITVNSAAQVSKTDQQSTNSTATAAATTINAQGGDDLITNNGGVWTKADMKINAIDVNLTLLGNNEADASVAGDAIATGIDAGTSNQKDLITNNGAIDVTASSDVKAGAIQLDLFDVAKVDATLKANATATGIKGTGSNEIVNNSTITVRSTASVTAWTGEVNVLDQATANTTITPKATSTGIAGGNGYNQITNIGTISVTANADAYAYFGELNAIDLAVLGAGVGSADDPMKSVATGIKTGDGGSEIVNSPAGKITANANSTANIASVILTLYDFTITADISKNAGSMATNVSAVATGISGGSGNDTITNDGEISASATSLVTSEGLGVAAEGVPSGVFSPSSDFYKPLFTPADVTIKAAANATGIQGGAGDDTLTNTSKITTTAKATTGSGTLSVSFPLLELTGLSEWLGKWNNLVDYPPAIAVAGAGTSAKATAIGIDAGAGNDTINNNPEAEINVTAKSFATTDQASVSLQNVKSQGGTGWSMNMDLALTKANTIAVADAIGLDGAGGNDIIENRGLLDVDADATAVGTSVSVVAELLKGMDHQKGLELLGLAAALTNVVTEAKSMATGIFGGTGNDYIYNFGQMEVDANALVNSFSANVSVQGEIKGLSGGVTFADTSTTSTASATGISGGDGGDYISNEGLHAYATSEAYTESFSVTVQATSKGVEIGGALALGTTTATATATGMDGGTGADTFLNRGLTDVKAEATANTLAASVDVQASVKGVGVGIALIDTTTSTTTDAIGVSGSDDTNSITNNTSGTIKVRADSNTYAESFAVTVQGESTGLELGGALALGSTKATATATGISGGKGANEIYNYGMVDVRADATTNNLAVAVDVQGSVNGVGLGVAFTDASTKAKTKATGISGGENDDTLSNTANGTVKAYAESDAYSELFSVNVQGKGTGIMIGGALALAGSKAKATATGMDGGAGNDDLINEGFTDVNATSTGNSLAVAVTVQGKVDGFGGQAALTDTSTSSTATTTGISGGEGTDTITNGVGATVNSQAIAEAYAESISVSVQGSGTGVTMAGSLARGVTTPTASATGISGGGGDDTLINHGLTDVKATTDSTSVAVAVRAVGVIEGISVGASLTDTSTTSDATAVGMDGGLGKDEIYNSGTIQANTDTTLRARSVSFDFGGVPIGVSVGAALASASTNATGTAIGINGGEGDDNITNASGSLIDVDSTAHTTSTAVSISANVIGAAWTDTSATTLTQATGIAGGEGKDGIANMGTIDVDSNSTARVANVSFNLIGATPVSGWTSSTANATGIDGGLGDDSIQNQATITADTTSSTDATGVAVQVAGYSNMNITTNAITNATGISGGEGVNTISNTGTGSITATATTYADTTAVNINLLGYSKTDGSSTGAATAIGIAGGKEAEIIQNDGTIRSTATSDIDASSTAVQFTGYGETNAKAKSAGTVKGIDGSDGVNTIINSPTGKITGTATALADASSYDIQLSGGAKATAGTEATATAIGIAGGKDVDTIRNEGTINLTAQSTLVSTSRSYKVFGVGFADADSKVETFATGIDGGEGNNTIINTTAGSIDVSSNASATATGMTANIGVAGASASTTSKAHSTGIKSGDGEDTIYNYGNMNVTATSSTRAGGGSFSLVGLSFGDSLTEAIAEGINAGGGNDTIINAGPITVGSVQDNDHPMAYSEVASVSFSFFGISSATFGSKAQATGILGGGGDDTIINQGSITVGDDNWMAKGRGYGFSGNFFSFFDLTSVGTTAETIASGIDGGDGNDSLLNNSSGVLTVKATSYAEAEGAGDTSLGSIAAFANSTTKATATGISGGEGNDVIENKGMISVDAKTWAHAYAYAQAGWGSPTSDAAASATAMAIGIDAGKGQNLVKNEGNISVSSSAVATPIAKSDAAFLGRTEAESTGNTKAYAFGILAGHEGNTVTNMAAGTINVTATAKTDDGQGNVAKAFQDVDARATAGSMNSPITAEAFGISLGNGADLVSNDGVITVGASSFPSVKAYTSSNVYTARSHAKTYSSAIAKGIAAGEGANEVINNGQINVSAWSHGNPITDSWSRDQTATANAVAESSATATGIEGDGNIVNTSLGNIDVKARATTNAYANTRAETTTPTATLMAVATGIATTSSTASTTRDRLWNDGNITVSAVAGEDENGTNQEIAYADTDLLVRSCSATATGTSTVDATGIRVGERGAEITNNGNMEVSGLAHAYLRAYADSRDYNPRGNAYSTAIAKATGISAAGGDNLINNYSTLKVEARVQDAYTRGDTWSSWSTCRSLAETNATATATGIQTGAGIDKINNYGQLTVVADADAESYAWADTRDNNLADEYETTTARAQADAIGIDAGSGNNLVNNSGSITVSAVANARAGAGGGHASVTRTEQTEVSAIGIKTGNGDDLVINGGRIVTSVIKNGGLPELGIGITTGGGSDQLFLMDGSEANGHIDLGDGDDWLTLVGTPVVTGNVTGANGIDTLVFDGTGSIDFTPMAFENAIKQGAGTYSVASLPTMQRIEIKQGVLQVNNNYQFSNSGFFQTFVKGDGSFGQLKVNGNTQLAGGLSVLKGPGPYVNGTTYNIIEAAAVNNTFSNVTLPPPNNFVSFGMDQFPNLVQIEAYVKDFTWLARNRVEWAVANYLDRILPSATSELLAILGQFQNFSQSEYSNGLSSLSPDSYDNFTRNTFSTTHRYTKSLQYRMNNVRSYLHVGQSGSEEPILLAYRGSDAGELYNFGRVTQIQGKYGLWLDAFGQWGDQEEKDGYTGFDYFMRGATLGFDHALSDKFMTGISVGYSRSDVDLDDDQGSGYIKSLYGSLYGSYFYKNLYIDGILSYGRNWYDNHRLITIGTDQRRVSSKHDGDLFSAYLQGGYYFDIKKWLIGPFTSLQYIYLDEESFKEKGGGGVSLNMDGRQTNSLVSELGIRLTRDFKTRYGSLIPEVSAAWLHDFDIDDRVITSSFAGFPGASFSVKGQDVDRNGATLGAGITFIHKSGLSTSLRYIGEFREKYRSNGIMGELRFTF